MYIESREKAVFDAAYDKNADMVFNTALKYSGNYHTAQEITQEVFIKLFTYIKDVNPLKITRWLKVTAKNMALNTNRNKREFLTSEMYSSDYQICHTASSENIFMKRLREREIEKFTDLMFAELYATNSRWYEALTLTYILEKPRKDTAEAMGLSVPALDSMIYRAKKWVKRQYGAQYAQAVGMLV